MGKFDGVLLASDFDQTYCVHGRVHPDNLAMLAYFEAEGGRFTVASGRAVSTFAPVARLAPLNAPAILANGAQVYDFAAGQMLMEDPLPPVIAEDLARLLRDYPAVGAEIYRGDEVYVSQPNDYVRGHHAIAPVAPRELPLDQTPQPWDKVLLEDAYDRLLPVQADLLGRWGSRYDSFFSYETMLEVVAKGCSKGARVLDLARQLGISRENIYCVGDNQNDLSMLAVAATPFAPGNCTQEVRDFGAVLLPPCDEGAIGQLIRILDKTY